MNDNLTRLEALIQSFAVDKNIPVINISSTSNLHELNQCLIAKNNYVDYYLISHEEVDIFENFFNLNTDTIIHIEKIRKFCLDVYNFPRDNIHKRLKISIEKDKKIEFSLMGDKIPTLNIALLDEEIIISAMSVHRVNVPCFKSDKFEDKLNEALAIFIPTVLGLLGFTNCTENSENVISFLNKSTNDLIDDHFTASGFPFLPKENLISTACINSTVKFEDVLLHNENFDSDNNVNLTDSMISIFPKIASQLSSDISVERKFKQLINLFVFYDYLMSRKQPSCLVFRKYSKIDFAPSSDVFNNKIYLDTFLFLSVRLTIGHQLKLEDDSIYDQFVDADNINGYSYHFDNFIQNRSVNEKPKRYFANDVDYIYDVVLNDIRSLINNTILNADNVITSRQLELFKMTTF